MSLTRKNLEDKENKAYDKCLDTIIGYADGNQDGVKAKLMVAAASAIAKQKQTRSATSALKYQIARDMKRKLIPASFSIEK